MQVKIDTKKVPNKKQQDCIENIQGKYLVLAGPGTGKTFTIVERIKNMLQQGILPEKILCLTFTDAGASEMKKRIEDDLKVISCGVSIFTYHGFCCDIIDEFQEEFEVPSNYKVISDPVSKAFIKECIDEMNPVYFRTEKNDPYFYINTLKKRIGDIKQNRLTKTQFFQNIKENPDWEPEKIAIELKLEAKRKKGDSRTKTDEGNLEKITKKINQAKELWDFYEAYQAKMDKQRYLDFNDMINLVLSKFESDVSFLSKIANRYEYIMVDEYQDTNKSQNEIVFALSHALESENVFVVGDDDQIIYRFQGAKLDTIENYLKEFPDTKIICLTENMRSTQPILDAARGVINQDPLSLVNTHSFKDMDGELVNKNLIAKNKDLQGITTPVRFYKYADIMQEYTEIVNEIEALINSEECPMDKEGKEKAYSQIAILTRSNFEAQEFAELLKSRSIPYELKEGKDIFTIPAVNTLYFYIQFLINPVMHSWRMFQLLMAPPFNVNPKDYQVLFDEVSKDKSFIDVLRKIPSSSFIEPEKFENFLKTYDYLREYKSKENIKNTILEIGAKTGIFDYYLNTPINRTESVAGLKRFIDEAVGFSEIYKTSFLEEFYIYLKSITDDEETISTEKSPVSMNAVQLCTYHSSKGREFEYVYMPTLITEKWEGSTRSLKPEIPLDISEYKTPEELKDEVKPSDLAKLMYVAMTRAKHTLRMSYPERIGTKPKKPTKFLVNIQEMLQKEIEPFEYDEQSYCEQIKHLLIKNEYDYKSEHRDWILARLADRSFSPSSVNRYLACPRQYLYQDILDWKAKDGNPNALSYGVAVHKACEKAIEFLKDKNIPPEKSQFIGWFKEQLAELPMESYEQRLNYEGRGEKALDSYYSQIANSTSTNLHAVEYRLDAVLEDGTKFIGFLDRVDRNEDGTFTIYDYKTGNNKNSSIKIGGEHEDYYNQIALYKYFFENQTGEKVSLTKFIYPEDFLSKNEGFNLSEEETLAVVEKFKAAVKGIKSCEFEPSYKETSCKYCLYKDYCGMNNL